MDELRMSKKERIRLEALLRVKRGEMTVVEAAELEHIAYQCTAYPQ
jgi:hypothetical protein